jgi:hypothetical protein
MRLLAIFLILFHIFYIRSETRTNFSFQSNKEGRAVTSVVRL